MSAGRPTDYSIELATEICARLAEGQSLRKICASESMPNRRTVFRWLLIHEEFSLQYACARDMQAETLVDEINDIADDGSNDYVERTGKDGSTSEVFNAEHVARSKLRIDARKWFASKIKPKKYGDKIDLTHGNPDGTPIKAPVFNIMFPDGGPGVGPIDPTADDIETSD